jgi:NTE family protein
MTHSSPPKIGLALGSGGARGLAHIGVIQALLESHIPIDIITGSSSGALIGGMYTSLGSIEKVKEITTSVTYKDLANVLMDIGSLSGVIRGKKLEEFLHAILDDQTIESLPLSFATVGTDLSTGLPVTFRSGDLVQAIRASSSIPAVFDAYVYNDMYIVDGGESLPVPVRTAKELGATFTIAVNLDVFDLPQIPTNGHKPNLKDMGVAALTLLRTNLSRELCREADITITPDVASTSSLNLVQFINGDEIIQKGYEAAIQEIPMIKEKLSLE